MILQFAIFFALTRPMISQNPTPCPELFSYEPKEPGDRWYGVIKFSAPKNITGIWLRIILDKPADILGNWFGQVTTSDNTVYDIRKQEYTLQAGVVFSMRFFVKYNLAQIVPSLETIKLNGQTICTVHRKETTSTTVKPYIKQSQVESHHQTPQSSGNRPSQLRPSHIDPRLPKEEIDPDSEYYPGDYNEEISPRIRPVKSQRLVESPTCGIIEHTNASTSLKDGETRRGQWPWHAALYRSKDANLVYICGATLITEQHIVTPAHCVTRYRTRQVEQPNKFVVSLGKFYLNRFETDIQDTVVANIAVHPEYNNSVYTNDIAVLKLSKPVRITKFVRPSCLWDNSDLDIISKEGTIVGWGVDKTRKLMHVKMTIVPIDNCISSESTPDNYYCAQFDNGVVACKIRSISGMVLPKNGTTGENTVWQIRGMSVFSEIRFPCDESNYTLFTDVAKYIPWIQDIISNV